MRSHDDPHKPAPTDAQQAAIDEAQSDPEAHERLVAGQVQAAGRALDEKEHADERARRKALKGAHPAVQQIDRRITRAIVGAGVHPLKVHEVASAYAASLATTRKSERHPWTTDRKHLASVHPQLDEHVADFARRHVAKHPELRDVEGHEQAVAEEWKRIKSTF